MSIVIRGTFTQQRQLRAMAQRSKDRGLTRRALAIAWLMRGWPVKAVSEGLLAARSSMYRWAAWFQVDGLDGLRCGYGGRSAYTVNAALLEALSALLQDRPRHFGYLRSTWSSELLSRALLEHHGFAIHPSTVRRVLPRLGVYWRRARPTLFKRDPHKAQKLKAIQRVLQTADVDTAVFFLDEADIDLNPRTGFIWSRRGQQVAAPTPGQNRKHYVAGALHARSGRLVWVENARKNSHLLLKLLDALYHRYRRARRIVLILDNYRIHKSAAVAHWLAAHPKVQLLFQPVYYPWVNRIERLWEIMHDTVTRNLRCHTLHELCHEVKRFFEVVQPFPGAQHGVARFGSAI